MKNITSIGMVTLLFILSACSPPCDCVSQQEYLSQREVIYELLVSNAQLRSEIAQLNSSLNASLARMRSSIRDHLSPTQRVDISSLFITGEQVTLDIQDVNVGVIGDTKSMDPLLDTGTIVLETTPQSPRDINPGDLIIYEHEGIRIIHRVVEEGADEKGWFAITKGDNNPAKDPIRVRFEQVRGVVVGIIY